MSYVHKKFANIKMLSAIVCALVLGMSENLFAAAEHRRPDRFTIVANVPDEQFVDLYSGLVDAAKAFGSFFDPRYNCVCRTNGDLNDFHGNLHITLASCDADKSNENKCLKAVADAITEYNQHHRGAININFNPMNMKHKSTEKYLIMPINRDHGYVQLGALRDLIYKHLGRQHVTGLKFKDPNHVTIGFMGNKAAQVLLPVQARVSGCGISQVTLYHWCPASNPSTNSREKFYPKQTFNV